MRLELNSDNDVNKMFGSHIAAQRKKLNITQDWLAKQLDVARPTIMTYEQGQVAMTMERAIQISRVLSIDLGAFFANPAVVVDTQAQVRLNNIKIELQENRNRIAKIRSEMAELRQEAIGLESKVVGRITDTVKR